MLVSIIIPFFNEARLAARAVYGALAQSYGGPIEVIVVDDGSTESIEAVSQIRDARVSVIRQRNIGPAGARNTGIAACQGEMIAFCDADDVFMPHKIETQVRAMNNTGAVFSHTSYSVSFPGRRAGLGGLRSGKTTGHIYPSLIGSCPIATPTVMLHRSVLNEGFAFPESMRMSEDTIAWINVASRHAVLGIDAMMTIVEWSDSTAAISLDKSIMGMTALLNVVREHPVHGMHRVEIESLAGAIRSAILYRNTTHLNEALIDLAFACNEIQAPPTLSHSLANYDQYEYGLGVS